MKARRKAPSAKQIAARKAFASKFGGKKMARRGAAKRRKASANPAPAKRVKVEEEETTMELEENPRRKKSRRKKARRKTARKAPRRKTSRRRKARSAPRRKASRRRSRRRVSTTTAGKVHVVRLPRAPQVKVIRIEEKKRRRRKSTRRRSRRLLENPSSLAVNGSAGGYDGLFENPSLMEAYSGSSLKAFGWAAAGLGVGLVFARGVDRYIATMKPADSTPTALTANNPWYGRNAVAAQNRRPGALRLGVQGVGALAGIGAAYATRNQKVLPWLLGGISLGFGSNLVVQVAEWFFMPRLLKIAAPNDETFANRMYVLEQVETQDTVDGYFENWANIPSLSLGQTTPISTGGIAGPLELGHVYTLGQAGQNGGQLAGGGQGGCGGCGGGCDGGCGGGCGGKQLCTYVVQTGDKLAAFLTASGVSIDMVNALNNGNYWVPGNQVVLPYEMCMTLTRTPGLPMQPPPDGTIVAIQTPSGTREFFTEIPGGPPVINYTPGTILGSEPYIPKSDDNDDS